MQVGFDWDIIFLTYSVVLFSFWGKFGENIIWDAMSASMNLLLKEVNDATECPICTGIFTSPKMLPCFHTFCLKCIEQYGKDTPEGDTLTCPLCRGEFKVPVGGLSKLKSNFFLEGLIATVESVPGMSQAVGLYCDVCPSGKKCKEAASSFCTECQQSMCDQCSNIHGSIRTTMTHHLLPLGDESSKEVLKKKLKKHFCDTHPIKVIEFYCEDCRISVCVTCSITKHNKHDIREIAEIAEESKERFKIYSNKASNLVMNIKERLAKVFEQLDSFADSIEQMKTSIKRRGEDIKQMVDKQTNDLLGELNGQKAIIYKTADSAEITKVDLQRDLLICDSFKQFCTKIVTEADHVETVSVGDEVETRAAELNVMSIQELQKCPRLKFIPSNFDITEGQQNIVGTIFGEC